MTREDFLLLSETEQQLILDAASVNEKSVNDLTAERDSLKEENETLLTNNSALTAELSKVKSSNYTLIRQLDRSGADQADPEEALYQLITGKEHK